MRIGVLAVAAMLLHSPGCARKPPDLVVATAWPAEARRELEADFARWAGSPDGHADKRRVRIEWVALAPGQDPLKLAFRATPPHVILGGPKGSFAILANMNRLSPIDHAGKAQWCEVARPDGDGSRSLEPPGAWNDPRRDRASLRWAKSQLATAGWRDGYARLVLAAAARDRIGPSYEDRSATAHARAQPVLGDDGAGKPADQPLVIEGVAIVPGAPTEDVAQEFLRFLVETQGARAPAGGSGARAAETEEINSLIADLLGSTLVDAQDELWTALRAIDQVADRERAIEWLTEPPPWPPASVAKYLGREGERAMALIETLAALVAPEAPERAWLLRSWLAPARPVDQSLLLELTEAAGGRLCREGRFRAWLREEWTAWARQRYRRVARWAGSQPNRSGRERTKAL
jgi:hypothetical protein